MHLDRRRALLTAAALGAAAFGASGCGPSGDKKAAAGVKTISFTDDVGRPIVLKQPVRRTVVFNRYTTEFIRAVAGTDVLVGTDINPDKDGDYWPTVTKAMFAGQGQTNPNFEAIISMTPDVVFFPRNSDYEKAQAVLKPFGIPVVVVTGWDVLKHEENVELLGRIYEQPERAARLNGFYRKWRDLLGERLQGVTRKRVYMEEVKDWRTLLKGSGWHDMIETGGGDNVFGALDIAGEPPTRGTVQGFEVDPEEVLARKPQVMIKLQPGRYKPHPAAFSKQVLEGIAARPGFSSLEAVKTGQVYHMSYYLAGGCSKIIGALQIAKWLYPERFTDIEPADAMKVWLEEYQGVPAPGGYWTSLKQVRA